VVGDFIKAFLASVTILLPCKKGRHAGDHIVVIIVVIKIQMFFRFWTGVNESV
jgi:hypothetical protein